MIKIRLQRKGRIRRPIYHIVVADSRSPRDGRIIEQVGRHDGVTEKKETVLNEERIGYWLDNGAQPTDSVRKILRNEGYLYKRHLQMWGKSEEEVEAALSEWKNYRGSKTEASKTSREQQKDILAAEEAEYKKRLGEKAAEAAAEIAEEEVVAEATEEAVEEVVAAEESEPETEAVADEPAHEAEQAEPVAEEAPAEEAPAEETAEATPEPEAVAAEEPAETAAEEEATAETTEEVVEEPVVEVAEATAEAPSEAPAETETAQTSDQLSAKEAIDHINSTDLADLEGFVTEAETRKTVLTAFEAKKENA
ncbi:MAG: 30S ribosomal protein S16 [Bacteroidota bacterium]